MEEGASSSASSSSARALFLTAFSRDTRAAAGLDMTHLRIARAVQNFSLCFQPVSVSPLLIISRLEFVYTLEEFFILGR